MNKQTKPKRVTTHYSDEPRQDGGDVQMRTKTTRVRTHYECAEDGRLVLLPGDQTCVNRVVSWVVWHLPELAGVLGPVLVAFPVTAWVSPVSTTAAVLAAVGLGLVSIVVAVRWVLRDVRQARENAAIKAGLDLPAVILDGAPSTDSDVDTGPVAPTVSADGDAPVSATSDAGGGVWL